VSTVDHFTAATFLWRGYSLALLLTLQSVSYQPYEPASKTANTTAVPAAISGTRRPNSHLSQGCRCPK